MRRDSFVYLLVQEVSIEEKRGYHGAKIELSGVQRVYMYIWNKKY